MVDLTDEEIAQLKELLPFAEQLKREAKYRAARRLVLETWRGSIIFYSGLIASVVVFNDQLRLALKQFLSVMVK